MNSATLRDSIFPGARRFALAALLFLPRWSHPGFACHGISSRFVSVFRFRAIGIGFLQTLPLLVLGENAIAGRSITLFLVIGTALAGMHDAGVHAPLGQALSAILTFACHGLSVSLNVAAVRARIRSLLALEGVLAALHMARRALLHLLRIVAGVVYLLVAELAFHGSLLAGFI